MWQSLVDEGRGLAWTDHQRCRDCSTLWLCLMGIDSVYTTCSPLGLRIVVHTINSLLLASFAKNHVHVRVFTSISLPERFFTSIGLISHPSGFGFYKHKTIVFDYIYIPCINIK